MMENWRENVEKQIEEAGFKPMQGKNAYGQLTSEYFK